tara:strand:- start:12799 stop:13872 length:1074 start_codon:yes stop_codon:yes gene_type:complete
MSYVKCCFLAMITILTASCIEYTIDRPDEPIFGVPNPPQLEVRVRKDVITQVVKPEVDVLWVIDNSCSMLEEQTTLINNFGAFIGYFLDSQLDWHIGVTSTDMTNGGEPGTQGILRRVGGIKYIDEDTPDPIGVFQEMASLGTTGSGNEAGIAAAYNAIAVHGDTEQNEGFYRENATLSIITISDEEDYSDSPGINEFISWLLNLKRETEHVTYSSIVCLEQAPLNGYTCGIGSFAQPSLGSRYISVTNAVGGILWDIREYDWEPVLDQLGLQAAGLKREYFLTEVPVISTLEVYVQEDEDTVYSFKRDVDYTYSQTRNSITFMTYIPPQYSKINIEYVPLGSHYGQDIFDSGDTGN